MHVDPIVPFEPGEDHGTASELSFLTCTKGSLHTLLCGSTAETHAEDSAVQCIVHI